MNDINVIFLHHSREKKPYVEMIRQIDYINVTLSITRRIELFIYINVCSSLCHSGILSMISIRVINQELIYKWIRSIR